MMYLPHRQWQEGMMPRMKARLQGKTLKRWGYQRHLVRDRRLQKSWKGQSRRRMGRLRAKATTM
jgi:hypothetical protein